MSMARPLTTITDAKQIAQRMGADGVAVIAFKDGVIHAASYGATKEKCKELGRWLDFVVDGMGDGRVAAPRLEDA
jgi:hypothetical protein